jgi:hypothetical protein
VTTDDFRLSKNELVFLQRGQCSTVFSVPIKEAKPVRKDAKVSAQRRTDAKFFYGIGA